MLAADHDARTALAALTVPNEATPGGLSRRRFLSGLIASGALAGMLGPEHRRAAAAALAPGDARLVVFLLGGGNDGLATVQPLGRSALDVLRPGLLVDPGTLRPLDATHGLHPSLPFLHQSWAEGRLAVVGGVGASGDLSHFGSMHDWMAAGPAGEAGASAGTGWLGRWLDTFADPADAPLRGVCMTGDVPLVLLGRLSAGTGLPAAAGSLVGADRSNPIVADLYGMVDAFDLLDYGQHPGLDLAARTASRATRLAARLEATFQPPVLGDTTLSQATMAARLLNDAEHGCRVALCSFGSFDHHVDLLGDQARSLAQVDDAARALFATLDPGVADRTVLLIHSEFGRRPRANGGGGTDHGTASYSFVVGPSVRGGLIGSHVALVGLDANGNPPITMRHLDLIGSVLGGWLGADPAELLGTSTQDLGLFVA